MKIVAQLGKRGNCINIIHITFFNGEIQMIAEHTVDIYDLSAFL